MKPAIARWALWIATASAPCTPALTAAQAAEGAPTNELAPTLAELMALRRGLASEDAGVRQGSLAGLMDLEAEALPVIRARLAAIAASERGSSERAPRQLFRRLASLRRGGALPPARVELEASILRTLEQDRSEPTLLIAELIALLRSLEAQRSLAAAQIVVSDLFALDPQLFRQEAIRARKVLGKPIIPALLRHRSDPRLPLQKLAREGLAALGMTQDARLFGQSDGELLAAIIGAVGDAYADHDSHDAIELATVPWVVAHIDDARTSVREAARRATRLFGEAADEALRQRMTDLNGTMPDTGWEVTYLLDKLVEQLDAQRSQGKANTLQLAQAALARGELELAERQLEITLMSEPSPALAVQIAAAYQQLGRRFDEANKPARALYASRRALRLDPQAKPARARLFYLEAERRLAGGVADLHALRTANAIDPSQPAARLLLYELRATRAEDARALRRQLGFLAAALVAIAACLVLYLRRAARKRTTEGSLQRSLPSA